MNKLTLTSNQTIDHIINQALDDNSIIGIYSHTRQHENTIIQDLLNYFKELDLKEVYVNNYYRTRIEFSNGSRVITRTFRGSSLKSLAIFNAQLIDSNDSNDLSELINSVAPAMVNGDIIYVK